MTSWIVLLSMVVPVYSYADEPTPVMVVMELRMDGASAGKNAEYREELEAFFRKHGSFAVIRVADAHAALQGGDALSEKSLAEKSKQIAAFLTQGADLVVTDVTGGITVLEDAASQIEAYRARAVESSELRERHLLGEMLLVRSLLEASRQDDARQRLKNIIVEYGEDLEVTRSRFHPRVVTAFESVWEEVGGAGRGALETAANTKGIRISLNGRPVKIDDEGRITGLLAGKYRLQLGKDGRKGRIYAIEVLAGTVTEIPPKWFEDINLFSGSENLGISVPPEQAPAKTAPALASRVGAEIKADYVSLIGVLPWKDGQRIFAVLVDVNARKRVWAKSWEVSPTAFASDRLVQVGQKITADWGVIHAGGSIASSHWYNSIAGWSLVALGIGGVVTSAVYGVRYSDKNDELNNSVDQPGFGLKQAKVLQEDAESMGTVSVIAGVAGGVAIATGITLFLIEEWGNEPSTAGARLPLMWGGIMPSADGSPGFGFSFQTSF